MNAPKTLTLRMDLGVLLITAALLGSTVGLVWGCVIGLVLV